MSNNEILIFGGWNYESNDNVLKLTNHDDISRTVIEKVKGTSDEFIKLPRPDFFIVNGVELCSQLIPHIKLIRGHQFTIQLDIK
jgi:hypothetical protein